MSVGSPTITMCGLTPRSLPSRLIISGAPRQPTSSSNESAKWIGVLSGRAVNSGTRASAIALKLFMSEVPRP